MTRLLLASLLCLASGASRGQAALVPDDTQAQLMQCLTKDATLPEYPEREKLTRAGGLVRVKLSFAAADKEPAVEVLSQIGSDEMVSAVRRVLKSYRLPCLPEGGKKVEAVQEFRFTPVDGEAVIASVPREAGAVSARYEELHACLRVPRVGFQHEFMGRRSGNLVFHMRFSYPDQPPSIKVFYNSISDSDTLKALIKHVEQYRLPCIRPGDPELLVEHQFSFLSGDKPRYVLKDLTLKQLLSSIRREGAMGVNFNLDTMGCPFQVVWHVGMPVMPNRVHEIGPRNLNRVEFLHWLSGLTLAAPSEEHFAQLMGQPVVIDVPCGTLNLNTPTPAPKPESR